MKQRLYGTTSGNFHGLNAGSIWRMLFFFLGFTSCTHTETLMPNLDLVRPYSYELEKQENIPDRPLIRIFERDGKRLVFLASHHENKVQSETFQLVQQAFKINDVKFLMIEGYKNSRGINPSSFIEYTRKNSKDGFYKGAESSFAAEIANNNGIDFVGSEPDEADILAAMRHKNVPVNDLLGFYFVRQVPQFKRNGSLETKSIRDLYDSFLASIRQELALSKNNDFTYERFLGWYRKANGKAFDLKSFDSEEAAPIADGKYYTQRISHIVGVTRDRFIVNLIAKYLNERGTVLIVFGKGHLVCQRPALESMLGKPTKQLTMDDFK
jgi:hypothetical protein